MAGRPSTRAGKPKSGSGLLPDGSFVPEFEGQRPPFEPGHTLSTRHGAHALVQLDPRAKELAAAITEALVEEGLWRPLFAPTVDVCAMVLAQLEAARVALQAIDEELARNPETILDADRRDVLESLRRHMRGWANSYRSYAADLGLSPASLARIAKDSGIGRAARATAASRALDEHVRRTYEHAPGELEA